MSNINRARVEKSHLRVAFCLSLPLILLLVSPVASANGNEKPVIDQEYSTLEKPAPVYPDLAIDAFIHGDVTVEYTVTAQGKVKDVKVIESDSILLDQAALDSTSGYIYSPRIVAGEAVDVNGVQTIIKFRLSDEVLKIKEYQDELRRLVDAGKNQEAIELIKQIRSSTPKNHQSSFYPILLLQGKLERELDNHESAIKVLEYLREKPDYDSVQNTMMWFYLADSYSHTRRFKDSIDAFESFLDSTVFENPVNKHRILIKMSFLAYKIPDYELSEEYLSRALKVSADNQIEADEKTLRFAARLYKKLKDNNSLITVRRQLVVKDPTEQNLNSMSVAFGSKNPIGSMFLNYARYRCDFNEQTGFMAAINLLQLGFYEQVKEIANGLQANYDPEQGKRDFGGALLESHDRRIAADSSKEHRSMSEFSAFQSIPDTCDGAFYKQVFSDIDLAQQDSGLKNNR